MFPEGQEEVRLSGPSLYLKESSWTASFDLLLQSFPKGQEASGSREALAEALLSLSPRFSAFLPRLGVC